jgi:hypothetical protein
VSLDEKPAQRFRRIAELAVGRGLIFRTATEVAAAPVEEILSRAEMIADERVADEHRPTPDIVAAVLGGVERPTVMLSHLVEMVENLPETENSYKNATQIRLWRNPRKRAVANLMKARRERGLDPDKPVLDINHQDALIHRRYPGSRVPSATLASMLRMR